MTFVCIIIFIGLSFWLYKTLYSAEVRLKNPLDKGQSIACSGEEALVIFMFATAWIGLTPVLSLRLGVLELLCILGLIKCTNRLPYSVPFKVYTVFLVWIVIGIFYSTSINFGFRMLLKYLYPFIFALLCAKVVRDRVIFMTASYWARIIGTIGIVCVLIPFIYSYTQAIFWFNAAMVTGIITMAVMSFSLADFSSSRKKNLIWGCLLCLPCVIVVYRTDIFGTAVALSMFFLIKYKLKALPIIGAIGLLGLCVMFYVPTVKEKMFINPDIVTIEDYLSGNIQEENVRNNMRKWAWTDVNERFYEGHETVGCGTGRVQTFYYTEVTDSRRGGQLHNDFLVLRCDNGNIGLVLFCAAYLCVFLHCMMLYDRSKNQYVRLCSLIAGSSLLGVFVTMFSDNTISYSMATLSFPWGFYGMALGMSENN